jgi:hypothetical protein
VKTITKKITCVVKGTLMLSIRRYYMEFKEHPNRNSKLVTSINTRQAIEHLISLIGYTNAEVLVKYYLEMSKNSTVELKKTSDIR